MGIFKFYAWVLDKLYKNISYTSIKYLIRRRRACLSFNITTPLIVPKKGEQKRTADFMGEGVSIVPE